MTDIASSLVRQKCAPCEGGVDPLPPAEVTTWSAPTAEGYTDFPFHPES